MKKSNEQSLGEVIQEFLKANNLSEKFLETEIYARWEELVGRAVNLKTRKVIFNNGVLTVFLTSAVVRNELSINKTSFVNKINSRIKGSPIQEIQFK